MWKPTHRIERPDGNDTYLMPTKHGKGLVYTEANWGGTASDRAIYERDTTTGRWYHITPSGDHQVHDPVVELDYSTPISFEELNLQITECQCQVIIADEHDDEEHRIKRQRMLDVLEIRRENGLWS